MANSNKYKELEERVKLCDNSEDKIDFLATMVFMIAGNDLATMEKKIKKVWIMLFVVLIATLFSNEAAISAIIGLIMKAL